MPMRTEPTTGLEYALLLYDDEGRERREADGSLLSETIVRRLRDPGERITDVFVMSHGWKGDVPAAIEQYDRWSAAMARCEADRAAARRRWADFRPLLVGFHWPSLPWGEESADGSFATDAMGASAATASETAFVEEWAARIADTPAARDALRVLYRAALEDIEPDWLPGPVADAYRTLEREAALGASGPAGAPDADREPLDPQGAYEDWRDLDAASFGGGGLAGGLLSPLRQLSFWTMKKRARKVGERGGHALLEAITRPRPGVGDGRPPRVHVMGHSFGCIVVSGMLRGDEGDGGVCVDSAFLVQGAMSLWSYASRLPGDAGAAGYFRPVLEKACVRGPVVVTTSSFDSAVGRLYPLAAGAARQLEFGGDLPKYGAIGAFGLQGAGVGAERREIAADLAHDYGFAPGHVYNVRCDAVIKSGGGLSGAHSDIAHPEVGHLFWGAVLAAPQV